ncbi:intraflagellar transport protein 70A isoform X2 [Bemisia tabaci]|uniref:intraflagellar transport protein 70A isoform X2 n=1 Tax=Bemisia tabaci TaxID=7038 RepID=UPI0008F9E313|nr:PREDICTED: tetratricopeptide repeat protein 30A isoform X2 [Bemisia tabaci]
MSFGANHTKEGDFTKTIYTLVKNQQYSEVIPFLTMILESNQNVNKLRAAIKYSEEDLPAARALLESCDPEDPDTVINYGCLLYKEGLYEEALQKFSAGMAVAGYSHHLSYNLALCYYRLKEFTLALKHIADIIERGIREHPELSVGMITEGIQMRSVGNTTTLHETALIEAFNLKAAIEYHLKNFDSAKEAITDMPPRFEEELDAVTLHNQALVNIDERPNEGYEKLQFLLHQNPLPPETLPNILLLYCKFDCHNLAADVLAENSHLTATHLSPYLYKFIDALITQQTAPEEAYRRFDEMASKLAEQMRKLSKQVQEAKMGQDNGTLKKLLVEYDDLLDKYIPVMMAQAKIFWDKENYNQVEKIFHKSVEFCKENDTWRLHVGHVLFMQDNKFKEATGFYEPLVKKYYSNILKVSAVVLANLCVSYIMTAQNEEAEELMRKIEKEEERLAYEEPKKKVYHLCIVNLVIGTLYCAKGNYEFGISRLIKSLEPYNKKLGTDTWFYAKRCMLSLIENLAKNMIVTRDAFYQECLMFLEQCELYGREVLTSTPIIVGNSNFHNGKNTVTYEARLLKALLLKMQLH